MIGAYSKFKVINKIIKNLTAIKTKIEFILPNGSSKQTPMLLAIYGILQQQKY